MIEMPKNVRPIVPGDEDKLFHLLCMAHEENAPYTMNEKKVRHMISEGATDKCAIIGVIDSPDKKEIAASFGAYFSCWWYTDDFHIEECWNFVHPNYRKSSYAKDILQYAKWISDQMQMPLHNGIMTATRFEAKSRLYRRQMPQVGAAFAYNMHLAKGPIAKEVSCE